MDYTSRRVSHVFLRMVPVLAIIFAAVRSLRVPGVYQAIGGVLFVASRSKTWTVSRTPSKSRPQPYMRP